MIVERLNGTDVGRDARPGDGGWSWLVTLSVGGRVLRYADADLADIEVDGRVVHVRRDSDLQDLTIVDEIAVGSTGAGTRTASVALVMPSDVSISQMARRGVGLAGSEVELTLMPAGGTISDRVPVLVGYASEPTYGADDEPVLFTVREPEPDSDAPYPPQSATVTGTVTTLGGGVPVEYGEELDAWDSGTTQRTDIPLRDEIGQVYPRAFGRSGVLTDADGVERAYPATRAIALKIEYEDATEWRAHWLLVSLDTVSETGDDVLLMAPAEDESGFYKTIIWESSTGHDWKGVPFTYVDLIAWEAGFPGATDVERNVLSWGVSWIYSDPPPLNGKTRPTAGDVLLWMVGLSSLRWDVGRCAAAAEQLSGFLLAGAIDARTTPTAWLNDHVFGVLPVMLASGPSGLYAVPIPYAERVFTHTANLTVGNGTVERPPGAVQVETDGRVTEVTVRWGREVFSSAYLRSATRTSASSLTSVAQHQATTATGPQESKPSAFVQDLPFVWDDGTALRILDWLCWREMRSRRTVKLLLDASAWGWLQVGDVVGVTDTGLHLDGAHCLLVSLERSTAPWWTAKVMPLDE